MIPVLIIPGLALIQLGIARPRRIETPIIIMFLGDLASMYAVFDKPTDISMPNPTIDKPPGDR